MTQERPVRIFVSAGEPSGDLHGAGVVAALRERWPDAVIDAFGGPAMAAAGADVLVRMEDYSAMGLVEVVHSIPAHLRLLRTLGRRFREQHYDLVLPIDYPGFHLRLVKAAHQAGARVLYYIPPALWGWRPGRARYLRGVVDRLAVILPFEPAALAPLGLAAEFVGNPLVDHMSLAPGRDDARARLGIPAGDRVLAIFPGSRGLEVRNLWPAFRAVALGMLAEGRCDRVVVAATGAEGYPEPGPIEFRRDDPVAVLQAADAVLAKSGTTTLQAALTDTPMVVAYRIHPWTFWLARRLARVRWVSLVNLVAGTEVVPEFLQKAMTVERLSDALRPLLDPASAATRTQRNGLALVRERLGPPGAARRVAAMAAELVGR